MNEINCLTGRNVFRSGDLRVSLGKWPVVYICFNVLEKCVRTDLTTLSLVLQYVKPLNVLCSVSQNPPEFGQEA